MVKFGLIVPLIDGGEDDKDSQQQGSCAVKYLVPALLKEAEDGMKGRGGTRSVKTRLTAYLVFATDETMAGWERKGHVSLAQVAREGFYPAGLFPRILGKAVSWMQVRASPD